MFESLQQIYDFISENRNHNLDKNKVYDFPDEFYPENYKPVKAIDEFLERGVTLFEMMEVGDLESIALSTIPIYTQHPVTGNTIAHLDYKKFMKLPLSSSSQAYVLNISNFRGIDAYSSYHAKIFHINRLNRNMSS